MGSYLIQQHKTRTTSVLSRVQLITVTLLLLWYCKVGFINLEEFRWFLNPLNYEIN